ncbi:TPA: hypothetical protein JLD07_000330 [Escherichia coli]|nr:hypothetical protein [Escherichia coli]
MTCFAFGWLLGQPRTARGTSASVLCTFWTRANFVSDERQARMIICHRQEIAFAVGEYHCAVRFVTI